MNVIVDKPPMFEEIAAVFPLARNPLVVFTWGYTIYAPGGPHLSDAIVEHERVHARQQEREGGPESWWRKYLVDPEFRMNEELPAHRAEYRELIKGEKDRNRRAQHLHHVAAKLAGPLYGSAISIFTARKRILAG